MSALCIPDDARRGRMINAKFDPDHVPGQFWALFVRLGAKCTLDAQGLDHFRGICGLLKPVLIVHGTEDKLVISAIPAAPHRSIQTAGWWRSKGTTGLFSAALPGANGPLWSSSAHNRIEAGRMAEANACEGVRPAGVRYCLWRYFPQSAEAQPGWG